MKFLPENHLEDEADRQFGEWLRLQREMMRLTRKQASVTSGIGLSRWGCLERGSVRIGVRPFECEAISTALQLPLPIVTSQAYQRWIGQDSAALPTLATTMQPHLLQSSLAESK